MGSDQSDSKLLSFSPRSCSSLNGHLLPSSSTLTSTPGSDRERLKVLYWEMGRGDAATAASSVSIAPEKKHWWMSNKKLVDKHLREARSLVATQEQSNVAAAVGHLDAALALSPCAEAGLELRARALLFLRRFREVADMLQDYIPSCKVSGVERSDGSSSLSSSSSSFSLGGAGEHSFVASSAPLARERANLLFTGSERPDSDLSLCFFSVSDLKHRVLAGLSKRSDREGQWRFLVLGQACCHLGLMEDAMVLLQTGRRLASAAFRRESVCWSDDSFDSFSGEDAGMAGPQPPLSDSTYQLLSHIKLVLRRRAAAVAALDAGLPSEAVRHFSKVLDTRRGLPGSFAAGCLVGRSAAYKATGRLSEAIADCNRALALDPSSIPALRARADLFEAVHALPDCLHDLEHLKFLHDAILRDRKLPGPRWRPHPGVRYRDIPSDLSVLTVRIQRLRSRIAAGEGDNMDYYALMGVRRPCTRAEMQRAHLLLTLKHKPEKAVAFVERLEFADDHRDLDEIRDQARMSASILYRMLLKGYANIMADIVEAEAAQAEENQRAAAAAAAIQARTAKVSEKPRAEKVVFQGAFCRDMAVVGGILSRNAILVKYEALSC